MMQSQSVEQLTEERSRSTSPGFWIRRSKLEKVLLAVASIALLACVALVGVVATNSSTPTATVQQNNQDLVKSQPIEEEQHPKVQEIPKKKSSRLPVTTGQGPSGERYEICNSQECILAAAAIIEAMDDTVSPCDNFYQYACGGWMEKNPVPEASSRWSQFDLLDVELSNALGDILTSPVSGDDPKPINQVKLLYSACMNVGLLDTLGVTPLTDFIGKFGGWPMTVADWSEASFDWQAAVADARRLMARDYLISVWVFADQKDTDATTIYIDQSSLGMARSVLVNSGSYEDRVNAYKDYMASTATIITAGLGGTPDAATIQAEVSDTLDFEIALANITSPSEDRRDSERMYNPMTITELNALTDGIINWSELLSSMFSSSGVALDADQRVIVQEVEYIQKLANLIAKTPLRTVSNYLMWRHVQALGDNTNTEMRDASFQYQMVTSGVTAQKPRTETCANSANNYMGQALGTKYVETYFSQQAKDEANEMVEDIRESFKDLLGINEWMDDETKPKASEKADAISKFIAYPDWYGNDSALIYYYNGLNDLSESTHFLNIEALRLWMSTDELNDFGLPTQRTRWFSPPTIVNAFYMPEFNSITFPAGILQPPFYRANSLQALNYGGIGQVIGHEITHGFDDQGRQNDKDGNTIPWWSNATLNAFNGKAECIVNQYGNVSVPDVGDLLPNATLNGINTQGENIADNGGLREAYLAYLKYVDRVGEEPRLPGIDQLTPYQLFFLSNANIWCGTNTKEGLLNQILTDPHSPGKFRVLVPMSNMDQFSTVWGCPADAPMNPSNKCVVW